MPSYAAIGPGTIAGAWSFDDNTAKDSSGNGKDGEAQGDAKWIQGKFVSFDNRAVGESADDCVISAFTSTSVESSGKLFNTWSNIKLGY